MKNVGKPVLTSCAGCGWLYEDWRDPEDVGVCLKKSNAHVKKRVKISKDRCRDFCTCKPEVCTCK